MGILDQLHKFVGYGRYRAEPTAVSNGDAVDLLTDAIGRLQVVMAAAAPSGAAVVRQKVAAKRGVLKSGAGSLIELAAWNSSEEGVWLQIHDKASNPADGETCVDQLFVPASGACGWRPAVPVSCLTGMRWAVSSTPGVLTLVASDCCGFSGAVS